MKVFKFQVDEKHAREHNEFLTNSRYFRASGILLGVLTAVVGVFVYLGPGGRAVWALILMLVLIALGGAFAAAGVTAGRKTGSAQDMYDRYPLIPAVVAENDGRHLGLLALVNTNVNPDVPPRYAWTYTQVKRIPNLDPAKVGNQLPAVAVFGGRTTRDKDHWQSVDVMPIAWGTPDEDLITMARKAIPQDQWAKLERGRKKLDQVKATPDNLLLL
ncbi:DUF3239 domain-containing protein [Corynebacterium guangdongense]|uniref:DUF3239 domain-containing protein n=1 Tax=Corynebacterium guangdongense TaxID=1783348 RepID=A0ABU1ZVG6_9CORY|nr:DUF3239 domain-containing protein [Corynebacterium guangdongense]MDR7328775.1 hypothetical protein [Corynebacterium guangdongense]WJZ17350.1 hypothetical protein CGUA_03790 [Corynebacterium guangdongense]